MSYQDYHPAFMPTQHQQYQQGSDAIDVWPQYPTNSGIDHQFHQHSQFEQHQPPQKRPRNSEDNNHQSMNSRMPHQSNQSVNKQGTSHIFFKTRICIKFTNGSCRNGDNCNFAHGHHDLRQPPPNWLEISGHSAAAARGKEERQPVGNWDDDQKIIHKMKLCKKFYNGEECPYGDRCNFLHEEPAKFRDDGGRFRESSAISIGTSGQPMGNGSTGVGSAEVSRPMAASVGGSDAFRVNVRPAYWKTKLCTKWETTCNCPFGEKCHFAHGQADLQACGGRTDGGAGNSGPTPTKPAPPPVSIASPSKAVFEPAIAEEGQSKNCLLKWKDPKKINRIYADWLDDLPLVQNLTNEVET